LGDKAPVFFDFLISCFSAQLFMNRSRPVSLEFLDDS
jgi:hypothetical protein